MEKVTLIAALTAVLASSALAQSSYDGTYDGGPTPSFNYEFEPRVYACLPDAEPETNIDPAHPIRFQPASQIVYPFTNLRRASTIARI
jgi:hypothetical protein